MKKTRILGMVLLLLFSVSGTAKATDFKLGSYSVDSNASDPGLVLWTSNLLSEVDKSFSLNSVGQTYSADLFKLGTKEGALNADDWTQYPIQVAMSFVAPPPGFAGIAGGLTGAAWLFGSFGYVVWDNPVIMAFGSSGLLGVTLTSGAFGLPGSTVVSATFELLRADQSVPEPGTLALLGIGATFASARLRRRRPA